MEVRLQKLLSDSGEVQIGNFHSQIRYFSEFFNIRCKCNCNQKEQE